MKKLALAMLTVATFSLVACGNKPAEGGDNTGAEAGVLKAPVEADADSLYGFVAAQVGFGPRVPGSRAHEACREYIAGRLRSYGVDTVAVQAAPVTTWDGTRHVAYNILGRVNPRAKERILLLAHYDTRPWADEEPREENRATPIDGANDGGSGVAVLLEIARKLQEAPLDSLGVDLLFVDLEDSGRSGAGDDESWCLGTQEWVKSMPYTPEDTPRFAVLLDMVGGDRALFHREHISQTYAKSVVDKVWALAAASGYADRFPNSMGGSVIDDHLHVNQAGIPCIDIIESYNKHTGSFNPTWHTTSDNLASIDRETLKAVTQVVLNLLYREAGHPLYITQASNLSSLPFFPFNPFNPFHSFKNMTINEKQDEIIDEFSGLDDWMDRYGCIIDMGNALPAIDDKLKTPDRLIEGCQSRVWLDATLGDDGKVNFTADSDAIIVKGIISMLIDVLSGHTPQEILDTDLYFIDRIGLSEHLSPTRSNGLLSMIKQMRVYALAFKELQESKKQ